MLHQTLYRHPTVIAGITLAVVLAVTGIFAPFLTTHDPFAVDLGAVFCPPVTCASEGQSHVLGTDHLGRDVLSRMVTSLRTSLYVGILGTFLGILAACLLVIVCGIRGAASTPDMARPLLGVPFYGLAILTYVIGVFLSIGMVAAAGVSFLATILSAGVFSAMLPMALVCGSVRRDSTSSNPVRLAFRRGTELSPIAFGLAMLMGLIFESSVSFIGVGVPPPSPSLGEMIAAGRAHVGSAPWLTLLPLGIVLVGAVAFWAIAIPVGRCLAPASQDSPAETPLEKAGRPAGFWIRLAASMITFIATMAVLLIAMGLVALLVAMGLPTALTEGALVIALLTAVAATSVASPGKRVLGLLIVRPDGSGARAPRKTCRWIVTAVTAFVDPFMIAFRKDKRGLHDLICDTVVVHRQ